MRATRLIFLGMLSFTACSNTETDTSGLLPPAPPRHTGQTNLRLLLGEPQRVTMVNTSTISVTAKRTYNGDLVETVTLPITLGDLSLSVYPDGTLAMDGLSAGFSDVVLSPQAVPPNGLHLTDIKLGLQQEADPVTTWGSDANSARAAGTADLVLDWSLVTTNGTVVPLAPQKLAEVPLSLDVKLGANYHVETALQAKKDGVFFDWSGMFQLADLKVDISAH